MTYTHADGGQGHVKRHLGYLGILLLAGVAINVFLVLSAGLLQSYSRTYGPLSRVSFSPELIAIADELNLSPGASAYIGRRYDWVSRSSLQDKVIWESAPRPWVPTISVYERYEFGLPFRIYEWLRYYDIDQSVSFDPDASMNVIPIIETSYERKILPGVALNALIYAAMLWGILWCARRVDFAIFRRRYRTARGWCPKCGYDLQKNLEGGCPECGWNREKAGVEP